jgi:hypothetical protein
MAHAQKPDFVFRRNGRVHLNRRGRQFGRLLAAEVCASAVVMLDTPRSEVVRVLATHSIRQFPLHFPSHASPCAIRFRKHSTQAILFYFCKTKNDRLLHKRVKFFLLVVTLCRGSDGVTPHILNAGSVWGVWVISFTPQRLYSGKEPTVHTDKENILVPRSVWTLWKRDISLASARNRIAIPRLYSLGNGIIETRQ